MSELKRVQATHGPYRGTQIDLPVADAEQAIADGWAIDPFAPVDPNAEPPEFDQDKQDKAEAAAEAAARKLRGEEDAETSKPKSGKTAKKADDDETTTSALTSSSRRRSKE